MIWVRHCSAWVTYSPTMYICICNAVTESAIRQAAREGVRSLRELSFKTGCSTQCGCCVSLAREVLDGALADMGAARSSVDLEIISAG